MDDLISRQQSIDAMNTRLEDIKLTWRGKVKKGEIAMYLDMRGVIETLPSAQPEQDVLAWLLAYHTKSFELHGRYFPHEVISWLVNDFSKEFIAERREEGDLK